jgi:hypothetical protein
MLCNVEFHELNLKIPLRHSTAGIPALRIVQNFRPYDIQHLHSSSSSIHIIILPLPPSHYPPRQGTQPNHLSHRTHHSVTPPNRDGGQEEGKQTPSPYISTYGRRQESKPKEYECLTVRAYGIA